MKITAISAQKRDPNRVNVSIDGKYRLSLDIYQIAELGLKVGRDYSELEILELEKASQFGKVYGRALEYCIMRPRSQLEVKKYLIRKTRSTRVASGEMKPGMPVELIEPIINRLTDKGYIDDYKFAVFWVENRFTKKGVSRRRLVMELRQKGVAKSIIDQVVAESDRNDDSEIQKVIAKKRTKYDDEKLIAYLARQGFNYDDIKQALLEE